MQKKQSDSLEVYYDGTCPMCTALAGALEKSKQKQNFTLKDGTITQPEGVTYEQAQQEIYVVKQDGTYAKNIDGIVEIVV